MFIVPHTLYLRQTIIYFLATCNDTIQNGDEEEIDCGGRDCAACRKYITWTHNTALQKNNIGVHNRRVHVDFEIYIF